MTYNLLTEENIQMYVWSFKINSVLYEWNATCYELFR